MARVFQREHRQTGISEGTDRLFLWEHALTLQAGADASQLVTSESSTDVPVDKEHRLVSPRCTSWPTDLSLRLKNGCIRPDVLRLKNGTPEDFSQMVDENVPAGTFHFLNPVGTFLPERWHVLHMHSISPQELSIDSKQEAHYAASSSGFLDNLWDVLSLLPIRRAAWGRPRLPSIWRLRLRRLK